ncbi:MAG: hypothetical protein IT285_04610 [Bdellovibrionales bacterium]|nr:hypothetical protein [Bdellovibrionales bacterium]
MRETPWNRPAPHSGHEQRYRNIMGLHSLTTAWLRDLDLDETTTAYQLRRVAAPEVRSHLAKLAELTRGGATPRLEDLVDASSPDEFLPRLEYAVWALQAWTLKSILERTSESERPALRQILEQTSWKTGRAAASRRWPTLPIEAAADARGLLAALRDSPFAGYPEGQSLLTLRCTSAAAELEQLACPHLSPFPEVAEVADDLCRAHASWMRGFVYGLNPAMVLEAARPQGKRCQVRFASL